MKEIDLQVTNDLIDFFNFVINNSDKQRIIEDRSGYLYNGYLGIVSLLEDDLSTLICNLFDFKDRGIPHQCKPPTYTKIKNEILPMLRKKQEELK